MYDDDLCPVCRARRDQHAFYCVEAERNVLRLLGIGGQSAKRRSPHYYLVMEAVVRARDALESAERSGRRCDALRCALGDLMGAMRNVKMEEGDTDE